MKVDFAKVYRNGVTGRAIAEAMMAISAFTRPHSSEDFRNSG
jgi:hypothetical protein